MVVMCEMCWFVGILYGMIDVFVVLCVIGVVFDDDFILLVLVDGWCI